MSSGFICGRTGEACPQLDLCNVSNAPLVNAVERVRASARTPQGRRSGYAGAVVVAELGTLGDTMLTDLAPNADNRDATICPSQFIERGASGRLSPEQIAHGLGILAGQAVEAIIVDPTI